MRALLTIALAALALPGCGAGEDIRGGGVVPGSSMTIAFIAPLDGPDADAVREMIAGAKLALREVGGRIGRQRVGLAVYDEDARPAPGVARAAIEDIQIAAVIGGLDARAVAQEVPITNAAGILQLSPGAADPALVDTPELHPSGKRTLFLLAPDFAAQAQAMLAAAGPGPVAVERDSARGGRPFAAALRDAAGDRLDPDADTILYAGMDPDTAAGVADALRGGERIVFGDAITRTGLAERLGEAAAGRARFVSAVPAEVPEPLASDFEAAYDRGPGPYTTLGFEAMRRVLAAIEAARPRSDYRQRIIDAYAAAHQPLPAQTWPARER